MRNIIEIKELSLPELEVYAHLAKTQPCKEKQAEKALLIAESVKVISCALDAGCEALSFLMARRHIEGSARALLEHTALPAEAVVREALRIAGDLCIYTNQHHTVEVLA